MMIFRTRGIATTRSIMAILMYCKWIDPRKGAPFGQVVGIDWLSRDVHWDGVTLTGIIPMYIYMGMSENVVYPFLPNGFADHYPY